MILTVFKNFWKNLFENVKEEINEVEVMIEDLFTKEEILDLDKFKDMLLSVANLQTFEVVGDVLKIEILTIDEEDDDELVQFSGNINEINLTDYYNHIINEILK
jgi:hypothetical protein